MKVFVTGATGFIGSAIVQELMNAGHQVLGLARSDAAASAYVGDGLNRWPAVHRLDAGSGLGDRLIELSINQGDYARCGNALDDAPCEWQTIISFWWHFDPSLFPE